MGAEHAGATSPDVVDPVATDGRRRRGERSREGVIDAILELLREGVERPTTTQIADRSGVSVRSVFRHFEDVESLYAVAVERHASRIASLLELGTVEGDTACRAAALVEHRFVLYPTMGPVRRAAERLRRSSPTIAGRLEEVRELLRDQLAELFAPELDRLAPVESAVRLQALEAVSSWYAWEELIEVQHCDPDDARAAMLCAVRSLVGCP